MIGNKDETKGARIRASRLELRVDKLEDKLEERQDRIDELRDELRVKEDRVRYLKDVLADLEDDLAGLSARRDELADADLQVPWLPDHEPAGDRPDRRAEAIRASLSQIRDAASELEALLDGREMAEPTDALDLIADGLPSETADARAAEEAGSVAELVRVWIDADPMDRYRRELLEPYAAAVEQALAGDPDAVRVGGAKTALSILKDAFDESRTYMHRRSAMLDDHAVVVDIDPSRFEHDPELAMDRFEAVLEQARALGAVDFFHNLHVRARQALDEGEEHAGPAAWLLADVTSEVLTDPKVKQWIESGM